MQGETIGVALVLVSPCTPFQGTLENSGAYVIQMVREMTGSRGFI